MKTSHKHETTQQAYNTESTSTVVNNIKLPINMLLVEHCMSVRNALYKAETHTVENSSYLTQTSNFVFQFICSCLAGHF